MLIRYLNSFRVWDLHFISSLLRYDLNNESIINSNINFAEATIMVSVLIFDFNLLWVAFIYGSWKALFRYYLVSLHIFFRLIFSMILSVLGLRVISFDAFMLTEFGYSLRSTFSFLIFVNPYIILLFINFPFCVYLKFYSNWLQGILT